MTLDYKKDRARQRLREEVYRGTVAKPRRCAFCFGIFDRQNIQGHHHNGYTNWWDVQWVCRQCHASIDHEKRKHMGESNPMVKYPHLVKRGRDNCMAKLTDAKVREIRLLNATPMRKVDIAKQFGITYPKPKIHNH